MSGVYVNSVQVPFSKSAKRKVKGKVMGSNGSFKGKLTLPLETKNYLHPDDANIACESRNNDTPNKKFRIIRLNVGGTIFETFESTLHNIPGSRLAHLNHNSSCYRQHLNEYFFDRDPEIFKSVLNYYRIGELHLPLHICGPLLEKELQYWGMPEQIIEKCCWIHYIQLKSQKYSLVDFENFFSEMDEEKSENRFHKWSKRLWDLFNKPSSSTLATIYAVLMSIFVILSIFAFVAETHPKFHMSTGNRSEASNKSSKAEDLLNDHESSAWIGLLYIDRFCVAFFSIDLFIRFICSPRRLKFLMNIITIIEILAVIPYYVDILAHYLEAIYKIELNIFLKVVHVLRIFGVLRILKILRFYSGLQVLVYTLRSSYKDLLLMLTFIGVATLFFSTLIYHVDDRTVFTSIPAGFWWSVITMTTVGYGDIYPKYFGGYVVGTACSLVGVLVVAFTVPILVNSFMLYYSHAQSMLMIRDQNNISTMSDEEQIYLQHTFNTLKRMSFYSFIPDFDQYQFQGNLRRSSPVGEDATNLNLKEICSEQIRSKRYEMNFICHRPRARSMGLGNFLQ